MKTLILIFICYLCLSCEKCKLLKFLECTNEYCGPWQFHDFIVNQKTLEKLFKDAISPFLSVIRGQKQKEQAFKNVMKLIGKYYRLLPFETQD